MANIQNQFCVDSLSVDDKILIFTRNYNPATIGEEATIGSICIDYTTGAIYKKSGITNFDWTALAFTINDLPNFNFNFSNFNLFDNIFFNPKTQKIVNKKYTNKLSLNPAAGAGGVNTITGFGLTTVGTASSGSFTTTNSYKQTIYTSPAATGAQAGWRSSNSVGLWRGNSANLGGFKCEFIFKNNNNTLSTFFCGLGNNLGVLSTITATFTDCIAIGYDETDATNTNYFLLARGNNGTLLKQDLGASAQRNTTDVYSFEVFCDSNDTSMYITFKNLTTNTTILNNFNLTTNLPANTIFFIPRQETRNITSTTASSHSLIKFEADC